VANITVSLDDQIYRRARIVAAERGTSVSALVKGFLEELGTGESEVERLRKQEQALRARIDAFRAGDRLPREALHERRGA
jgi:phage shock protein A